jgi:hypothetical protein
MRLVKLIFGLSSILASNWCWAQVAKSAPESLQQAKNSTSFNTPTNATIDTNSMYVVEKRALNTYAMPKVTLKNIQTIKIDAAQKYPTIKFATTFEPKVSIGIERKQAQAFILIPQYIQLADGSIEKITRFEIQLEEQSLAANKTTGSRVYAQNSVLASGNWYKIAIANQGVYKVDYNFIKNSIGVDLAGTPSKNIRLYGNGGEMLPENNAIPRADDLVENAIEMVDGGDGVFNVGDYFLFYANGPHTIIKDSANRRFTHQFNVYSEVSHYFLTFDNGNGKRIQTIATPSTSNVAVTSYNDFYFYEKDSVNPGKFGKLWWGDEFNDQPGRYLNRNYNLNFPNIDPNTLVQVRTRVGAFSSSGTSVMNVNLNGTILHSIQLAAVGLTFSDPVLRVSDLTSSVPLPSSTAMLSLLILPW